MLLNLHCHSLYSDGVNSILELATNYKEAGHIALVLTDHSYFLDIDTWDKEQAEAARISKLLNYPIIVGLEAYFSQGLEEILVFGTSACRSLLTSHALCNFSLFKEWYDQQQDPFALVLAHPSLWLNSEFYKLLDGYEIVNNGIKWADDTIEKMKILMPPPRRAYINQDLHSLQDIDLPTNQVDKDLIIENEIDLIRYLAVDRE